MKLTLGSRPPCTKTESGQFWLNIVQKGLHICTGNEWISMLEGECLLDIVDLWMLQTFINTGLWNVNIFLEIPKPNSLVCYII